MPDVTLAEKIHCLSLSATYPGEPSAIEVIETHWSWVFLTPEEVYKLKKPIITEYQDFSSLAVRRQNCLEEVRLNRRLAETVYLGAVPMTRDAAGKLQLRGKGEIVEWLVHMRRLPSARMLDTMIKQHRIDWSALDTALSSLCDFYRRTNPVELSPQEFIAAFRKGLKCNRQCLLDPRYQLNCERTAVVLARQQAFLRKRTALFRQRVTENRIIEVHGDLRPEHICLTDPPAIIDCLEFSRRLRLLDPVDELAYFSIECEAAGAPQIREYALQHYLRQTDDHPPPALVSFYLSHRACVRARLAALHLLDDPQQRRRNWLAQAREYLRIADRYALQLLG